jgi:hypothetical protein
MLQLYLCLTLWGILSGCGGREADPLPHRLGDAPLIRRVEGDEARAVVDRMHGRGVAPVFSQIGYYGDDGGSGAVLYASVYQGVPEASAAEEKMRVLIGGGGGVFSRYAEYQVEGCRISGCDGMGGRHYFFSRGRRLYWLAAPKETAFSLVQEMLRLSAGD